MSPYNEFKSRPTPHKKHKIESSEDMLLIKMAHVKYDFECKLIESLQAGHSKPIYTYMSNLTNVNTIPSAVNLDNINAVSDNEKATLFNQYFHSVFTSSNFRLPEVSNLPRPGHFIDAITITESDVYHALLSLDPSKAMGCDGINPKLLYKTLCSTTLPTPALSLLSKFVSTLYPS